MRIAQPKGVSEIRNPKRIGQVLDFKGLKLFDKMMPTDIDGVVSVKLSSTDLNAFFDHKGKIFFVVEAKLVGAKVGLGQHLALRRMCELWNKSGEVKAVALIIAHGADEEEVVDAADCTVTAAWFDGYWHTQNEGEKLDVVMREFIMLYMEYDTPLKQSCLNRWKKDENWDG